MQALVLQIAARARHVLGKLVAVPLAGSGGRNLPYVDMPCGNFSFLS